jgi:hypothetical protein
MAMLTIALVLAAGPAALAQFPPQPPPASSPLMQGTEQERAACHPDVVKYCQAELKTNENDVFGILGCLQRNRSRISSPCNQVLASHGQ